jgi:hypothetical protein
MHDPKDDSRDDRSRRFRQTVDSLGVGGAKFISECEDDDFLRGLRMAMQEIVDETLVSAQAMQGLHPGIDSELAKSLASTVSLAIIVKSYHSKIGHTRIGPTDFTQVIAGTRMATYEGLNGIALAVNKSVREIVERARVLALLPPRDED